MTPERKSDRPARKRVAEKRSPDPDPARLPVRDGAASGRDAAVFVVDRREGRSVILVADDGTTVEVQASRLPKHCRTEGAVLRVLDDPAGAPDWESAVRDDAEEARRVADLRTRVERLRRSDPGGDVVL